MRIAIIDYKAGNTYSVIHALQRLGAKVELTADKERIQTADKVVFPGQGEAGQAMRYLRSHHLDQVIRDLRQPVLGICIGQQLLCEWSDEGNTPCLGVFPGAVVRRFADLWPGAPCKVPHIGWNSIAQPQSALFKGIEGGEYVYFVHSYCVPVSPWTIAVTDYVQPFSAALHRDNFYATQFHPEKSGSVGERILQNFLDL